MGLKREKMCINGYNVHWLPTSWNSSGSGVILCQCGFVQESNHWIVPTHLQALRVQSLVVSEDFGVWTCRTDLAPSGCPQLSCACSPAVPALFQSFSPDPCVVLTAHSYSWGLGAGISCFDIFKVTQESQESTPIPGVLYRAVVSR